MRKSAALLLALVFLTASSTFIAEPVASSAEVKENSWTTKAPVPQTEGIGRAAAVNGKIYVMGSLFTYEYDPATDNWVEKTPMPTPRATAGIAVYQNKMYAIGGSSGWTQETGSIYSGANEVYDPSTDTWETKEPMPTNRSVGASVVYGKIHLIGPDSHDVYDIATDSWTTGKVMPFSYPAWTVSSTVFDDKIYLLGGNETQIYDAKSDTWSLGAAAPIRVSTPGVCATTGVMASKRIYVFGGTPSFLQVTDVTQVYDPKSDTWVLGAPMLTARAGLTTAVVNDVIYAIGGGHGWGVIDSANEQYIPFGYGAPDPFYDSTAPEIAVASPENKTYYNTNVTLDFVVNEPTSWMSYSLDGLDKVTVAGNTTLTGLSVGEHNVTVYAWDATGNAGVSETVTFTVGEPETFPTALVAVAFIASAVAVSAGLLVYFKKRKH
jgi:hypothetical protein